VAIKQTHWTGVIEFTGAAQSLVSALFASGHTWLRDIALTAGPANANPFYIGHDANLTSANFGTRIPAPTAGEPVAPYIREGFAPGTVRLEEFFVLGTAGQKVHIDLILYPFFQA
jgi:hypothetical protein